MKNKKLSLMIVLLLILLTALSGCGFYLAATQRYEVNQTETSPLDKTSKIEISAVGSEILVVPSTDENVEVIYEGSLNTSSDSEPALTLKTLGKTMTIKIDYGRNNANIGKDFTTLTVYIPEDYYGKISVNSISGNINIDSFTLSDLVLKSISGKIECNKIHTDTLEVDSISGNIIVTQLFANNVDGNNISGKIILEIPNNMYLNAKTSSISGNVSTKDGSSTSDDEEIYVDLSTISGTIEINRY